ncbi:hypothetical protein IF803_29930 [Bradyrhizobium sp. UFLA06-06]
MSLVVAVAAVSLTSPASDSAAAATPRKLSGAEIRARLVGMQLTDEVHYRYVYEPNGTLRSYAMGTKKVGKWSIENGEMCLRLGDKEDGCYAVIVRGDRIEMVPSGLGLAFDGIVEPEDRDEGQK